MANKNLLKKIAPVILSATVAMTGMPSAAFAAEFSDGEVVLDESAEDEDADVEIADTEADVAEDEADTDITIADEDENTDDAETAEEEISDAETVECVKEALKEKKGKTVLLIGFPRSKESLAEWKKAMIGEYEIKFVLYLECDSEELKKRVSANGLGTEEVEKEIKAFETETAPIIKDYEGNDMVMKINAKGNVEEVFEEIKKSFIEKKIEKVVKE